VSGWQKAYEAARRNPRQALFADLQRILVAAGFTLVRTRGSHHVYTKAGVEEIVNFQPKGKEAKAYQVRQVLNLIEKYNIKLE
jgi:predicted RNA binding protein YcfA (HicA-like mRNA interferase family)